MFRVGDKVVYPMHGAGSIGGIEQKEILGKTHRYYILHLPISDMKVMIPIDSTGEVGLRRVIDSAEAQEVLAVLSQEPTPMSSNWNRRYHNNLQELKSGDIFKVAAVVRNLAARDREKGLSANERKMFENAKQILISELALVGDWDEEEINTIVQKKLFQGGGT